MFQNNIPDFMTNAKKLPNVNMDNLLQSFYCISRKYFDATNTETFLKIIALTF